MQTNYSNKNFKMVVGDTESFGFEITGVSGIDAAFFSCKRESQDISYLFHIKKFLNNSTISFYNHTFSAFD